VRLAPLGHSLGEPFESGEVEATTSELEPGRRIELLTYALRGGPGPCLAASGDVSALLSRSYQIDRRVVPGRITQFYGMNMDEDAEAGSCSIRPRVAIVLQLPASRVGPREEPRIEAILRFQEIG
jgi:hypothetical protein